MTQYHSKYYATYLTLQKSWLSLERISRSIINSTIDLNPHQVEWALFFFKNPLSQWVILADEVWLGKTIEAGLVICQLWSEYKRKILLIVPASLRKQWANELQDKFQIPSMILDGPVYKEIKNIDNKNPFNQAIVIICSYDFAWRHDQEIAWIQWDVVVLDEAHKLRNVYKEMEKEAGILNEWNTKEKESDDEEDEEKKVSRAKKIKEALQHSRKLLLTATPLQNSLMELYWLTSYLDDFLFWDIVSFKEQYMQWSLTNTTYADLKQRLGTIVHRTLRKQVKHYISYTNRKAFTQSYKWSAEEKQFYTMLSDFLMTSSLFVWKNGRPNYFILFIYWKILASSNKAILSTLNGLTNKLKNKITKLKEEGQIETHAVIDGKMIEESTALVPVDDQWIDQDMIALYQEDYENEDNDELWEAVNMMYSWIKSLEAKQLQDEIWIVKNIIQKWNAISKDSKVESLKKAIETAYEELEKLWANRKILIFTESRMTQGHIYDNLVKRWYWDKTILFNGSNDTKESSKIYADRKNNPDNVWKISWSKTSDLRNALVDYFKNTAEIMIATESAAEWINLQFCSLVINYDLPWNPQRVEQRIGRCHRYWQKHDVIVMNLVNTDNRADERIYELLKDKLNLFDGMFWSSDEILWQLENGIDIERKFLEIMQTCRTPEQIDSAFDKLQNDMKEVIEIKLWDTRKKVIDSFDEDVVARLKESNKESALVLSNTKKFFWNVSKEILKEYADFDDDSFSFDLKKSPIKDIDIWKYVFADSKDNEWTFTYRTTHPLWEYVLKQAKSKTLSIAHLNINITNNATKISIIEKMKWKSWFLKIDLFRVKGLQDEEYFVYNCIDEKWITIAQDIAENIMKVWWDIVSSNITINEGIKNNLIQLSVKNINDIKGEIEKFSDSYFSDELTKLDKWANDIRVTLERKVKNMAKEISQMKTDAMRQKDLVVRLKIEQEVMKIEEKQKKLRRKLYDEEDSLEEKKRQLIKELQAKMEANYEQEELFTIKWSII